MNDLTYYTTQYLNGDASSFYTKRCEYTTLDALDEALHIAKYLPSGSKVVFSDRRDSLAFAVERVGEHGISIIDYNGDCEPKVIESQDIPNHFRGTKHVKA